MKSASEGWRPHSYLNYLDDFKGCTSKFDRFMCLLYSIWVKKCRIIKGDQKLSHLQMSICSNNSNKTIDILWKIPGYTLSFLTFSQGFLMGDQKHWDQVSLGWKFQWDFWLVISGTSYFLGFDVLFAWVYSLSLLGIGIFVGIQISDTWLSNHNNG